MTLQIGAVSYLNTKPLIFGLQTRLPHASISFDLPSRLADRLAARQLDLALIPSVEFLRSADLSIVSDACIACRGAVRSVRLLFRRPPAEVKTLALDEGSRTSAALAQVLLRRQFDVQPAIAPLEIDAHLGSVDADALLIIGDRAMQIGSSDFVENWDLGECWMQLTGLPFVFAMWVSSSDEELPEVVDALQRSRDDGLLHAEALAEQLSAQYGITQQDCLKYFREQLYFHLGDRELAGLDLFRQWATEYELLPANHSSLEPTSSR